jgi:hypothetical protein
MVRVASSFMAKDLSCKSHLTRRSTPTLCVGQLGVRAMKSLRKIIVVWAVLTVCLYGAVFIYSGSLPPDELIMANSVAFRAVASALVVGFLALIGLFIFLFFGSIVRSMFRSNTAVNTESPRATRLP